MTDARVDRQRTTQLTSKRFDPGAGTADHGDAGGRGRGRARAAGLRRRHRGHPRAGDALSRPELRARAGGRRRRRSPTVHRAAVAVLPRRARGPLRLRHARRDHRDRQLHYDRDLAHRQARPEALASAEAVAARHRRAPRPLHRRPAATPDLPPRGLRRRPCPGRPGPDRGGGLGDGGRARPAARGRRVRASARSSLRESERDALLRQRLLHRALREVRQLRPAGLRRGHPGPAPRQGRRLLLRLVHRVGRELRPRGRATSSCRCRTVARPPRAASDRPTW